MSSGVFVLRKDGALVEMNQREYDSEDMLQNLLAEYPNLMAGNLINELNPRKWLLVSREIGVPGEENSGDRWSLDHLFLDQEGIPTLVEVKRSSDTRIRREVIGQMLEYAANAVSYWKPEQIRNQFEAKCERAEKNPELEWSEKLETDEGYEEFWEKVDTNLKTGKIRMLFIADEIPMELKQIVEFMNEQMNPAEVLALEIKQYVGQEQRTLIPRLFGQTSKTQIRKSSKPRESKNWNEQSFLEKLEITTSQNEATVAKNLFTWGRNLDLRLWWGKGANNGSCYFQLDHKDNSHYSFSIWTNNRVEIQFYYLANRPIYDSEEKRNQIRLNLNQIQGVEIQHNTITRLPNFPITALTNEESYNKFTTIWEEYFKNIRSS